MKRFNKDVVRREDFCAAAGGCCAVACCGCCGAVAAWACSGCTMSRPSALLAMGFLLCASSDADAICVAVILAGLVGSVAVAVADAIAAAMLLVASVAAAVAAPADANDADVCGGPRSAASCWAASELRRALDNASPVAESFGAMAAATAAALIGSRAVDTEAAAKPTAGRWS